ARERRTLPCAGGNPRRIAAEPAVGVRNQAEPRGFGQRLLPETLVERALCRIEELRDRDIAPPGVRIGGGEQARQKFAAARCGFARLTDAPLLHTVDHTG